MQIIVGSLVFAVISLASVVLVVGDGEPAETPMVSYLSVLMAIACLVGGPLVAGHIARIGLQTWVQDTRTSPLAMPEGSGKASLLANVYQTRLIVAAATIEGAAILNLVAYLLEGRTWTLAAAAVLLFVLLMQFPTSGRVETWVENQLESVAQLRDLSD
ncbi:MAG: hypothetical protein GTO26_09230 [Planctomycetales bacterium]|nr:hypothetical protein [Planctomycetales bacterium]NIO35140.1 hypothetical protein [Planctomycetales bacterium]